MGNRRLMFFVSFLCIAMIVFLCIYEKGYGAQNGVSIAEAKEIEDEDQINAAVTDIIGRMTVKQKVAQLFFITPEALTGVKKVTIFGDVTRKALNDYPVGGIVYFSKNLREPEQTKNMLKSTQDYMMEIYGYPVFLGVDEEGGTVSRIERNEAFGVEKVGAMGELAKYNDVQKIYDAGVTIGENLSELGFNVDFAPVADVITDSRNKVVGNRSFGTDAGKVSDFAWSFAQGLNEKDVFAVYKHFPGHGGTVEDSHKGYAYSYKTLEELNESELLPFKDGSKEGIDFIMVSHISTPNILGDDTPASLSKFWVTDVLRNEFGYEGIIITDSFSMKAISDNYTFGEAAVKAFEAGCDMLLMQDGFVEAYDAVCEAVESGEVSEERLDSSVYRIIRAKFIK